MPSPTQITTVTSDALALLTSRYSKQRPFTPFQLQPVFWYRTSQGLTVVPTNDVKAWVDNRGSVATPAAADPTEIPTDANFSNAASVKFLAAALASVSVTVSPDPTVLTIVVVGSSDSGGTPGLSIFQATLASNVWNVIPGSTPGPGVRIVEALVVARSLTADEIAGLKSYYLTRYGVGLV